MECFLFPSQSFKPRCFLPSYFFYSTHPFFIDVLYSLFTGLLIYFMNCFVLPWWTWGIFFWFMFPFQFLKGWWKIQKSLIEIPWSVQWLHNGLVQQMAQRCSGGSCSPFPVLVWNRVHPRNKRIYCSHNGNISREFCIVIANSNIAWLFQTSSSKIGMKKSVIRHGNHRLSWVESQTSCNRPAYKSSCLVILRESQELKKVKWSCFM